MVYGSLSIVFLILLKNNEAFAQCTGRVELLPQFGDAIPSTAYMQPVGQVCFPAVIQIPETNSYPNIAPTQSDDDDYLALIFLLISALTGFNGGNSCARSNPNNNGRTTNGCNSNSCAQNNSPNSYFDLLSAMIPCLYDYPSSNSGYICGSNSCPCTNFNQFPTSNSYANDRSANYGSTCDICGSNYSPFPNSSPIPTPSAGKGPSSSIGCTCEVCANSSPSSSFNPFDICANSFPPTNFDPFSALMSSIGNNIPSPSSGYICDSCTQNNCASNQNTSPSCIYVPFPIAVPMSLPGFNFNDYYPDSDNGVQEINLIIQTECD